jgi:hypothetical protein
MKVHTNLRAGIAAEQVWHDAQSTFAHAGQALGAATRSIAQKAQAAVNDAGIRKTVGKLMWWPFGPPRL